MCTSVLRQTYCLVAVYTVSFSQIRLSMTTANNTQSSITVNYWAITFMAAAVLMITMGARQSLGLFVSPLNTATGLGLTSISFAMAVGQFTWGAIQPVAGAVADKYGPGRVIAIGLVLLAFGSVITPMLSSEIGLVVSIGLLSAAGAGAGSFSVLIGAVAQRIPDHKRGMASGVINAGGSFGQFVFAPIVQKIISVTGHAYAFITLAVVSLLALPLAYLLRRPIAPTQKLDVSATPTVTGTGLKDQVLAALKDRSYLLLHAGFFTCGFHIAFLVVHLPGEVQLCQLPPSVASWSLAIIGLANIVGSLLAGWGVSKMRSKYILFWMYASRALLVGIYLMAPKTDITFYLFAAGLGLTWLATVPPTAGVVAKLFGTRYLGTLFGLTLLSHQIGGFLGAYLGGLAMTAHGNYMWMWWADIALAIAAALCNLPIREAKVQRAPQFANA
jgi:MFS family permease